MNSFDKQSSGLAAGTLVTTPNGDKKIEEIKAGNLVLSGVGTSRIRPFEVKKASAKSYCGPILRVTSNSGNQFSATPNHICFAYSPDEKYTDDAVRVWSFYSYDDDEGIEHSVGCASGDESVTNLEQAEEIARRMSRSNGGLEIKRYFTDVVGFKFMPTSELKVGMKVLTVTDSFIKHSPITNITKEHYDGLVYDLDIPEARNFAANGVLVHDSTRVL